MKRIISLTIIFSFLFLNLSIGQFIEKAPIISCNVCNPTSIYAEDIDKDGDIDLITASSQTQKIQWHENDGFGNFINLNIIAIIDEGRFNDIHEIISADLNEDGRVDILSATRRSLSWYRNNGNGSFSEQIIISTRLGNPKAIYAKDLDKDGDLDVLSASASDNKIVWYRNDGSGNFSDQNIISSSAEYVSDIHTTDLNNDGDIDVVTVNSNDQEIVWYENNGRGFFSSKKHIARPTLGNENIDIADFDKDGDIDIITGTGRDKIIWYENDGNGVFGSNGFENQTVITEQADGVEIVKSIDMDNDNDSDVIAIFDSGEIVWFENTGSGEFLDRRNIVVQNSFGAYDIPWLSFASYYRDVLGVDIDNDNKTDIVTVSAI
ncbi:MAG: VCBS repeat-containing protein, partial [Bacteroidota bacterium]